MATGGHQPSVLQSTQAGGTYGRKTKAMQLQVVVRDGRIGRDPAQVTDEGGPVLGTFQADRFIEVGERINLPDGTMAPVIGSREEYGTVGATLTLFVGDS